MPKTDQLHYSDSYRVLLIKLTTLRTTHDEMPTPTTDRAGDVPACVCVCVCVWFDKDLETADELSFRET